MKYHSVFPSSSPSVSTLRSRSPASPAPLRRLATHTTTGVARNASFSVARRARSAAAWSSKCVTGISNLSFVSSSRHRWFAYARPHLFRSTSSMATTRRRADASSALANAFASRPAPQTAKKRHAGFESTLRVKAFTRISSRRWRLTRDVPESGDQRYRSRGAAPAAPARRRGKGRVAGNPPPSSPASPGSFFPASTASGASPCASQKASMCLWKNTRSSPSPRSGGTSSNPPTASYTDRSMHHVGICTVVSRNCSSHNPAGSDRVFAQRS
mmetsp:Transcript_14824/g.62558  ORF Transcript_14824/g.62558 Transcript_14824/m.62558 type:complete len:271 (-) Transcript_14824:2246-3058(-)